MSVTAPKGFAAAAVEAGIRRKGLDLTVVRSIEPAVGGAMFSRNKVQAACLLVNREHVAAAEPQAVVINSGVAHDHSHRSDVRLALTEVHGESEIADPGEFGLEGSPGPEGAWRPAPQPSRRVQLAKPPQGKLCQQRLPAGNGVGGQPYADARGRANDLAALDSLEEQAV